MEVLDAAMPAQAEPARQPDIRLLGKDMEKYAGKSWGQLPGELRNQILQDMKARYGEDYARIIKLYFEQIAEMKEEKK